VTGMSLRLGCLYPEIMSTYGDRGNVETVLRRCEWRGIRVAVTELRLGDRVRPEELDLIRNKITLRRRVGGPDEGWHLKLPVRKDTRQEVRTPLSEGDTGSVPAELAAQVQDLTAGRRLHPIAILDTERTVVTLTGKAGDPLAEVADDLVTATRLDQPGAEPMRWREIEVEAVEGAKVGGLLEAAGQALRQAGARRSASASKLGRLLGTG